MPKVRKTMKLIPETHQRGALDLDLEAAKGVDTMDCDVGLQTAQDGRIWLCLNGRAFVRFKPAKWMSDGKTSRQMDGLTPGQRKLQKKHGNPAEFATAVYNCVPGDISMDEARAALEKYQKEWDQA